MPTLRWVRSLRLEQSKRFLGRFSASLLTPSPVAACRDGFASIDPAIRAPSDFRPFRSHFEGDLAALSGGWLYQRS